MAGFDTWVQAGGAGINLPQIVNQAQVAKQNDLLLQYAPAREARAQAQETRLQGQETRAQSQENRLENIYKTREEIGQAFSLSKFISRKDIDGAIGLVSENGITEKEKPILEILNNAKNTGDMTQLEAVYQSLQDTLDRSVFMGDVKQDAAPTRKKTQGADGFWYYDDDQSRVLPNVQAKPEGGGEAGGGTEKERARKNLEQILLGRVNPDTGQPHTSKEAYERSFLLTNKFEDTSVNAVTGQGVTTDAINRQATRTGGKPVTSLPSIPQEDTMWAKRNSLSGPTAVAASTLKQIGDFAGLPNDATITQDVAMLAGIMAPLISAYAVNEDGTRMGLKEQEIVEKRLGLTPSFWTGVGTFSDRMIGLDKTLKNMLLFEDDILQNPQVTPKMYEKALTRSIILRRTIATLGVQQDSADPNSAAADQILGNLGILQQRAE